MRAILTPDDLKKGDLAPVGWHPVEIVDYEEKPADSDGSTNCIFRFKILDGDGKGIQAQTRFNEKALGFGKAMYAALGMPKNEAGGYELTTELFKQCIGRKLKIYIKRGKSDKGNEYNEVADYMPLA